MEPDKRLTFDQARGDALVVPDGAGKGYWQPKPANGYAEVILAPTDTQSVHRFSMGRQLLPPGGRVRLHAHDRGEEVFYVLKGSGVAEIDGQAHRLSPGTTLYFGHNRGHTILNDGDGDLSWVWFFMPGGLDDFFSAIGRARAAGEAAPAPFERPADVREIEKRTVFK